MQSTSHFSLPSSNILIRIGLLSVTLHILMVSLMFYHDYNFISCAMQNYEWFSGTITMLLLIEHTVWLHLVWTVSIHNSYSHNALIISFVGVLFLSSMWIMELVVPIEPDPLKHHVIYAILFVVGCMINSFSSLTLIPDRMESGAVSYRHFAYKLNILSVLISLMWFLFWVTRQVFSVDLDWHIGVWLQYLAFTCYLLSLDVVFFQFSETRITSRETLHHAIELDECV
jgi:hypothetical protein